MNWQKHVINVNASIKDAMILLEELAQDAILFIHDDKNKLLGSVTDGDVRRGLLSGHDINESVILVAEKNPHFIRKNEHSIEKLIGFREKNLKIIPVLADDSDQIIDVINFRLKHSFLPIEAIIMAGGEGQRLRPLTEKTPKPLLQVGEKPIIEHNLDALSYFGIEKTWLSVNYLSEQLEQFASEKSKENFQIQTVNEPFPMGTIGSIKLIPKFEKDIILVCNCDLLTDVDFEALYLDFINSKADLSVVSIPYSVDIPYAVLELNNGFVRDFKEKPTYTYYSNGGIYLFKKSVIDLIPNNSVFSATDLMEKMIQLGMKIRSFPHHGYWLDIGKHDDYNRAQSDVSKIKFFHG